MLRLVPKVCYWTRDLSGSKLLTWAVPSVPGTREYNADIGCIDAPGELVARPVGDGALFKCGDIDRLAASMIGGSMLTSPGRLYKSFPGSQQGVERPPDATVLVGLSQLLLYIYVRHHLAHGLQCPINLVDTPLQHSLEHGQARKNCGPHAVR